MPAPTRPCILAIALVLAPACGFAACEDDPGRVALTSGERSETIALATAAPGFGRTGDAVLDVSLCETSAAVLAEMTGAAIGQQMSLDIDGAPVWSAVVVEPILGGRLQISGAFTGEEVEEKARLLREAARLDD
ncbi:SecDF P1 head subdomain-containing protein [Maliponia aquimaris]|uniref:Preprotein translocase subunit SecD n=1 Tax=Maliponia aquimaris TaxID=1673631 RepID=A0A238K7X1_9RHOB|nr:hypothetical protein [Maliponia aquimaris]SMX38988.1 preprotein translocase subunit SecD [Maliponia aquimaris]